MTTYDSSAIEVLTGLEPVRKRPGMYTTTERPNHLAQEVIDNSADEAIAEHCDEIIVTLHDDGSLSPGEVGAATPVAGNRQQHAYLRQHAGVRRFDRKRVRHCVLKAIGVAAHVLHARLCRGGDATGDVDIKRPIRGLERTV